MNKRKFSLSTTCDEFFGISFMIDIHIFDSISKIKNEFKRRFINENTILKISNVLKNNGEVRIATDSDSYVAWILHHFLKSEQFIWKASKKDDFLIKPSDWPATRYENKAISYRLSVFPNPASTDAKILFDNEVERNIIIILTDVLGKTVSEIYANKLSKGFHEFDVNLSDFDKGLYFLTVSSNNQNLTTKKVIIK